MKTTARKPTLPPLPDRPASGHKGLFGRVLVVGGEASMFGAAVLAATAALRAGSGLVQVAVPRAVLPHAIGITPELVGLGLDDADDSADAAALDAAVAAADVLVVGPGMGRSDASRRRLFRLAAAEKPGVFDADALNLFSDSNSSWIKQLRGPAVLTPHPGEMARLLRSIGDDGRVPDDDAGRLRVAKRLAEAAGQVVLLKGHRTVITDGRRAHVNDTGDSTLSKAGAGDVLSGLIGSLVGQGMDVFDAAVAAAWIHGAAGELAGRQHGRRGALARDVIDAVPAAVEAHVRRAAGAKPRAKPSRRRAR